MEEYFSTEDFAFACFLKASGIDLRELQMVDPLKNKCAFVFRLYVDSKELSDLEGAWNLDSKSKRLLFANKMLKKELKIFLTKYNKDRKHHKGGIETWGL